MKDKELRRELNSAGLIKSYENGEIKIYQPYSCETFQEKINYLGDQVSSLKKLVIALSNKLGYDVHEIKPSKSTEYVIKENSQNESQIQSSSK